MAWNYPGLSAEDMLVSVADGLKPDESVAINLPDEVTDGSRVQPVTPNRSRWFRPTYAVARHGLRAAADPC